MTTLTTAPLAPLLAELFAADDAAPPPPALAALTPDEIARAVGNRAGYRALYAALKDAALPVSRATGTLLYMLARGARARTIVEFGTSFAVSTLHLAAALRDNGGGRLITSEFEPSKVARARANLARGGVADLVELREGDALDTLAHDLPDGVDLLLLDGAKALYGDVLDLVEPRLRAGAFVVADNADFNPDFLARLRAPDSGYLSLPFAEDVELSLRLV